MKCDEQNILFSEQVYLYQSIFGTDTPCGEILRCAKSSLISGDFVVRNAARENCEGAAKGEGESNRVVVADSKKVNGSHMNVE